MAHSIVGVNEQQVCDPLLYLVKNKLLPTGMYKEDNPVYSPTMTVRHHDALYFHFFSLFKSGPLSNICNLTIALECIHVMNPSCCCLCHQGGLRGDDPQITLTAFVLIALLEAKEAGISCSDPNVNLQVNKTFLTW